MSRPAVPVLALAFGLSLLSLLGWVNPDPYNMRFALWFPALFALAFPLAAARVRTPAVRWAWYGLAAGCLGLNLLGTLTVSRMTPADWRRLAATPVLERSAAWLQAETRRRIGPTYARALSVVPPGEVIGYSVEEPQVIIYPLYGADLSRRIRYVPLRADGAAATLMRRDGVRYLFVWRPRPEIAAKLGTGLADGTLRQVSEGLYVRTD